MEVKKRRGSIYFLGPLFVEWIIYFAVQLLTQALGIDASKYAVELTILIALIALPIFLKLYKKDQKNGDSWWETSREINGKTYVVLFLMGSGACIGVNNFVLLSGITLQSQTYQYTANAMYSASPVLQLIGLGVVIPIVEELLYRGLLYRRMREYVSFGFATLCSAFIFGFSHGNMVQFIFATIIAVVMAYLVELFRTVKVSIVFHIAVNITSLVCTWTGFLAWVFEDIMRVALVTMVAMVLASACEIYLKKQY